MKGVVRLNRDLGKNQKNIRRLSVSQLDICRLTMILQDDSSSRYVYPQLVLSVNGVG